MVSIYCAPDPEATGPVISQGEFHLGPILVQDATQTMGQGFYTLQVLIPWAFFQRATAPGAVLFHAEVTIGALGEAHSGGKTSLTGGPGLADRSNFVLLTLDSLKP